MKKRTGAAKISSIFILALGLSVTAFSMPSEQTPDEILAESVGYTSATSVRGINNFRINGFNSVDDRSLILKSGVRDRYLITLRGYCSGLRSAHTIGTTSTISQLTKFDNVIVPSSYRGKEVCAIDAIYKLEGKLEKSS